MTRRLSWALRLVALVGIAGGLSGCAVYPVGYGGYRAHGYGYGYGYGAPAYRPYYGRGYYGGGYYGGGYGRGYGGRGYW